MNKQRFKQSTERKSRIRIPDTFVVALVILGLSTLPYYHDLITDFNGLKSWVPVLGIEKLLTSESGVLGFSTYRVFIYTLLIFIFSTLGYYGWYQSTKNKIYHNFILLATVSGAYHVLIILFNLRRTFFNDPFLKVIILNVFLVFLLFHTFKKQRITPKRIGAVLFVIIVSTLPFYHDVLTLRNGALRSWIPNFGIAELLTDREGYVRGLGSYRVLVYFLSIHLFSHLGWAFWFFDSMGKMYRPFLLTPVILSFYQVIVILMSWQKTEFNSPDYKLYITLIFSVLLAINFYKNNKIALSTRPLTNKRLNEKSEKD